MNSIPNSGHSANADRRTSVETVEETLRLMATLPAPEGLTERVKAGLSAESETGKVLMWCASLRPGGGWIYGSLMRGAAAAAIVGVVAGGGWRIYSHVQPSERARVIVSPSPATSSPTPFSNAGARRVPETLVGPVLTHPLTTTPEVNVVDKAQVQPKAVPERTPGKKKRASSHPAACPVH